MKQIIVLAVAASLFAGGAFAQSGQVPDNLEKLSGFKTTGVTEFTFIEQGGDYAAGIRKTLERISMPDGFKIELYAVVPDARHMAVGPQGIVTFVGTRKDKVWSVTDRNKDRVADEVKDFAPSLTFSIPNGPCFSKDGFLYIAEQNRVLLFPAAEFFYESPDVAAFNLVAKGDLIPPDEESFNHTARVCRIGPDGKIYISLGQPFNVAPAEKMDLYNKWGIGGMIRLNLDGTGREVYTYGIRNSVGHDFHKTEEPPADTVMPVVATVAHAADLGMHFYTGRMFPEKYKNAIFSAQHGSWNRTTPVGARVMVTFIDDQGNAAMEPFAEGWLDEATGEYLGRPVDVAQLPDGSILVSDDLAGALYRISYAK